MLDDHLIYLIALLRIGGDRTKVLVGTNTDGKPIGKYSTLDEALEKVDPNTTIFLTEGVY